MIQTDAGRLAFRHPLVRAAVLARIEALRGAEQVAELEALVAASGANAVHASAAMALGSLHLGLGRPAQALDRCLVVLATARPDSDPLFVFGVPQAVEAADRARAVRSAGCPSLGAQSPLGAPCQW